MKKRSMNTRVLCITIFLISFIFSCSGGGGDSVVPDVVISESGGSTDLFEGNTSDSYTVALTTLPSEDVTITITPDEQTDIGAGPSTPIMLTFTGTNGTNPKVVSVTAFDDGMVEGTHTSDITHSAASLDPAYDGLPVRGVTANISDNDGAVAITETGGSTDVAEGSSSGDTYEVVLVSQPMADVTISIQPDSQSTVNPLSLLFIPGNWDSPRTVTVTAVDDGTLEGSHSSTITHNSTSADFAFNGSSINDVIADITDNDRFVYVTNVVRDIGNGEITAYSVDPPTGALTELSASPYPTGDHPNWVAVEPIGKYLYVPNSDSATISGYKIDVATGNISQIPGSPFQTGNNPGWVVIHPSGKFAYITYSVPPPGNLRAYAIDGASGALSIIATYSAKNNPRQLSVDPTGSFLYVVNFDSDNVSAYTIDQGSGMLIDDVPGSPFTVGTNPNSVAVDPASQYLYVANFNSNTISGFTINANGSLTPTVPSTFAAGIGPRSVTVSPGQFLYAANMFSDDISAFQIDDGTMGGNAGSLITISGSPFPAGNEPRQVAVDPAGTFAFTANHNSEDVSAYTINGNGSLSPTFPPTFPAGIRTLSIATIGVIP